MTWMLADEAHADIIKEIERGSDRSCAIVAASYLEERLAQTLRFAFEQDDDIANRFFKGYGPLGSFAAKIDLGYLIAMYGHSHHRAMHTVKDIRNAFAHTSAKTTFKTQRVNDLCKNLPPPARRKKLELTPRETAALLLVHMEISSEERSKLIQYAIYSGRDTPRNRFLAAIKSLLVHLALIHKVTENQKTLCRMDPAKHFRFWPWPPMPSLQKSDEPPAPGAPSPNPRRKRRVRPRRPSPE